MWSPEMELIDQLGGGPLPLKVVLMLFGGNEAHARQVLNVYVDRGAVTFDRGGSPIPAWEAKQVLRDDAELFRRDDLVISATDAALEAFDSGRWQSF